MPRRKGKKAKSNLISVGETVQKGMGTRTASMGIRPKRDPFMRTTDGFDIPVLPKSYLDIRQINMREPLTFAILNKIDIETFRNGIDIVPAYWGKCNQCGYEYETKPIEFDTVKITNFDFMLHGIEGCLICDTGIIFPPDYREREFTKNLTKNINQNGDSLIRFSKYLNRDLNIMDDCFVIYDKEYFYDESTGELLGIPTQVLKADPEIMLIAMDETGALGKNKWTCFFHRDYITNDPTALCNKPGHLFNLPLFPVFYVATSEGGLDPDVCYIEGEVYHTNRFYKNPGKGIPPAIACWNYQYSNLRSSKYIADSYDNGHLNSGFVAFPGSDQGAIDELVVSLRAQRENYPFDVPFVSYGGSDKQIPIYIRLMDKIVDMGYDITKLDIKETLAAFFGVMLVFLASQEGSSGLNNEQEQITINDRNILSYQEDFNSGIYVDILKQFGVKGWKILLKSPEQENRMEITQQQTALLQLARQALGMNLNVELFHIGEKNDFDIRISGEPKLMQPTGMGFDSFNNPNNQEDSSKDTQKQDEPKANQKEDSNKEKSKDNPFNKEQETQSKAIKKKDYSLQIVSKSTALDDCISKKIKYLMEKEGKSHNAAVGEAEGYCREELGIKQKAIVPTGEGLIQTVVSEIKKHIIDKIISELQQMAKNNPNGLTEQQFITAIGMFVSLGATSLILLFKAFVPEFILDGSKSALLDNEEKTDSPTNSNISAVNINLQAIDRFALEAFQNVKPFMDAFSGLTLEVSNNIREKISGMYKGTEPMSFEKMREEIKQTVNLSDARINNIVRTEYHRFYLMGREIEYRELMENNPGTYKFTWLIRDDSRTTAICKKIAENVPVDGLPLDQLKQLVYAVQDWAKEQKLLPPNWINSWNPHFHCRSRMVREVS